MLRFTMFGGDSTVGAGLWKRITGADPDTTADKRNEGFRLEQGTWNGCVLRVQHQPYRTDVFMTPRQSAELPDGPDRVCS